MSAVEMFAKVLKFPLATKSVTSHITYVGVVVGGGEGEYSELQQVSGRVEDGRGGQMWWKDEMVDLPGDNKQP